MNKPVYIVYQIIQTNKKICFWRIKKRNHKTKTKTKTKIINKQLSSFSFKKYFRISILNSNSTKLK